LASRKINDTYLVDIESNALTGRLHAEAKVENGNASKADIILCDPTGNRSQRFNYFVEHIIEIKHKLNTKELNKELDKFKQYQHGPYHALWIVSALPSGRLPDSVPIPANVNKLLIRCPEEKQPTDQDAGAACGHEKAKKTVLNGINRCLRLYGHHKKQYKSYYWCNYEHEEQRKHSYPSEGDFNARLYHELRKSLPQTVEICSEYDLRPASRQRMDFLIRDSQRTWSIPLEVKMNWDQFKPKYKNGKMQKSEANRILDRFSSYAAREKVKIQKPILVVIQGKWKRPTKMTIEEDARKDLQRSNIAFDLLYFDEYKNRMVQETFPAKH